MPTASSQIQNTAARIAIVTGAAQGIGESIALRLADDGVDVAVFDLPAKQDQLNALVKKIQEKGRRSFAVVGDVSVEADVVAMIEKTVQTLGGLDIVRLPEAGCIRGPS